MQHPKDSRRLATSLTGGGSRGDHEGLVTGHESNPTNESDSWRQREDWALGCIAGIGKTGSVYAWILGGLFAGIGGLLLLYVAHEVKPEERHLALLTGAIFLAFGLLIFAVAAATVVHRRKFGVAHLWLVDPPGYVGGSFAATLHIGARFGPDDTFRVRLECMRTTYTRAASPDSEGDDLRESLWLGEEILRPKAGPAGDHLELPFRFQIPSALPATSLLYPKVDWVVQIVASQPGLDFREHFEVPIIAGRRPAPARSAESPAVPGEPATRTADLTLENAASPPADCRIEQERRAGPLWPGTPGIGLVGSGIGSGLSAVLAGLGRTFRWILFLLAIVLVLTIVSAGTQSRGSRLLNETLSVLERAANGVRWAALLAGSLLVLAAAVRGLHRTWHLNRFGISILQLDRPATPPGGWLRGVLKIPRSVVPDGGFAVRLLCVRMRGFRRSKRGHFAQIQWASDWHSVEGCPAGMDATLVPLALSVPADRPESGEGNGRWQWYVEAHARLLRLNYIARFRVTVRFAGEATVPGD